MKDKKGKQAKETETEIEIEDLKKQIEENKSKYLRALADYQNLEKRVNEERIRLITSANLDLITKLLPFLDNLEKAEVFVKDQGLKMAKDHLLQTLKEAGIEESEVLNKPFDPMTSEAIEIVKGEKDDMVVQVLRKGYKFGDRILRVAQVKVSKKINN
jgi:molecular chaperone GrpE